jgi:hypothetical protein
MVPVVPEGGSTSTTSTHLFDTPTSQEASHLTHVAQPDSLANEQPCLLTGFGTALHPMQAPTTPTTAAAPFSWQNPEQDVAVRQHMVQRLLHALRLHPDITEEGFLSRLPRLVVKIEAGLYWSAASMDVYQDLDSLRSRMYFYMKAALNYLKPELAV